MYEIGFVFVEPVHVIVIYLKYTFIYTSIYTCTVVIATNEAELFEISKYVIRVSEIICFMLTWL